MLFIDVTDIAHVLFDCLPIMFKLVLMTGRLEAAAPSIAFRINTV